MQKSNNITEKDNTFKEINIQPYRDIAFHFPNYLKKKKKTLKNMILYWNNFVP